jgi:hypothetical protein
VDTTAAGTVCRNITKVEAVKIVCPSGRRGVSADPNAHAIAAIIFFDIFMGFFPLACALRLLSSFLSLAFGDVPTSFLNRLTMIYHPHES